MKRRMITMELTRGTIWNLITILGLLAMPGALRPVTVLAQEHPAGKAAVQKSTIALSDVASYLETYVKQNSGDGLYSIMDNETHEQLALRLVRIHRERLSQVSPDMYFVCTDFKTADNVHAYDLDFFIHGTSTDDLSVVKDRTSIHKKDGVPRYTWVFDQKKQVWVQKAGNAKAAEHPHS